MVDEDFKLAMNGWRLATAEVIYYLPDHPALLQSFMWQTMDIAPDYPRMRRFLDYWKREIEAVIHSVRVASGETLEPATFKSARHFGLLH